jgi:hypothetical protein
LWFEKKRSNVSRILRTETGKKGKLNRKDTKSNRRMGRKETGLVPKGRHFGLQFLEMGGACFVGYQWKKGATEFIQSRTAARKKKGWITTASKPEMGGPA